MIYKTKAVRPACPSNIQAHAHARARAHAYVHDDDHTHDDATSWQMCFCEIYYSRFMVRHRVPGY